MNWEFFIHDEELITYKYKFWSDYKKLSWGCKDERWEVVSWNATDERWELDCKFEGLEEIEEAWKEVGAKISLVWFCLALFPNNWLTKEGGKE